MNDISKTASYRLAVSDREIFYPPIRKLLREAKSVLSIAHPFSDGDALGAQVALHRLCKAMGKRSVFLNFDPIPETISWLGANEASFELSRDDHFDLVFLLETTDIQRMKERSRFFEHGKIRIHLDHH
ncbi:hypothetical protein HYY75_11735, partial [bacterium]|nr:hypothetical protein [bacterium]